jgi:hypothetical protein
MRTRILPARFMLNRYDSGLLQETRSHEINAFDPQKCSNQRLPAGHRPPFNKFGDITRQLGIISRFTENQY